MPPPGSSENEAFSPAIALVTRARAVEVRVAALLEPHGLTLRRFGMLGHIAATPGLSLSDLARRSGVETPTVPALVRSLVAAGWVRATTSRDGLPTQVAVTAAGSALLVRLSAELAALDAEVFAGPDGEALAAALAVSPSSSSSGPR